MAHWLSWMAVLQHLVGWEGVTPFLDVGSPSAAAAVGVGGRVNFTGHVRQLPAFSQHCLVSRDCLWKSTYHGALTVYVRSLVKRGFDDGNRIFDAARFSGSPFIRPRVSDSS